MSVTEIIVRATPTGAEVLLPALHGPVTVPLGCQMKVKVTFDVMPCEIVDKDGNRV